MTTCLYKSKPCDKCGVTIKVGEDCEYVSETKTVRHWDCNAGCSGDPGALADALGYRHYSWEELQPEE